MNTLPAKQRRVNPIKARRKADLARAEPMVVPMQMAGAGAVNPAPKLQKWVMFLIVGLVALVAYSLHQTHLARLDHARAEAKAEVQSEVIEDLRKDRDNRVEKQAEAGGIGELIYSIFSSILTLIHAVVSAFVDMVPDQRPDMARQP